MDKFELAISLLVIAAGSFIMGAACVGIQLDKVKKQRDETLKRMKEVIDKFQGEAGTATGGDEDRLVFSGLNVHEMLNEIEVMIEEMQDEM
ncbi:hypothetical protein VNN37_02410 [Lactococcus garvieae]|uniref:hypothetical protein n=1 Tax=Lactococcus garvieae TaxID=1363 RepID=UPI0030CA6572